MIMIKFEIFLRVNSVHTDSVQDVYIVIQLQITCLTSLLIFMIITLKIILNNVTLIG